ncbi:hypothetical protein NITMOv2_2481 [Nitrospira moscoviensis]|uniref:Uncharacterized protein n=1 Tax=Nitrospira moscoviensis TaxID=42253 RepID=A0A0K2GDF7_NITMO|nr:hypothetical protein NITMOv2_2481 [Nitrospira moscoviensis]
MPFPSPVRGVSCHAQGPLSAARCAMFFAGLTIYFDKQEKDYDLSAGITVGSHPVERRPGSGPGRRSGH